MAGEMDRLETAALEDKIEPSMFHVELTQSSMQEFLSQTVLPRVPHPHPTPSSGEGHFPDGTHFEPPTGSNWGWHDPVTWQNGWDDWFFTKDPNYELWRDPINFEGTAIAHLLDSADTQGAADELASDLYALKGDRYAQDDLLSAVYNSEQKSVGADLELNNWNQDNGTWDTVEVWPNNGSANITIPIYNYADPQPWK